MHFQTNPSPAWSKAVLEIISPDEWLWFSRGEGRSRLVWESCEIVHSWVFQSDGSSQLSRFRVLTSWLDASAQHARQVDQIRKRYMRLRTHRQVAPDGSHAWCIPKFLGLLWSLQLHVSVFLPHQSYWNSGTGWGIGYATSSLRITVDSGTGWGIGYATSSLRIIVDICRLF